MTDWKPKPGEMVGVVVNDADDDRGLWVLLGDGGALIKHGHFHRLPAPDPHAELKQAVVETAKEWRKHHDCTEEDYLEDPPSWDVEDSFLRDAVDALLAAQKPPSVADELEAMGKTLLDAWATNEALGKMRPQFDAAIALVRELEGKSGKA